MDMYELLGKKSPDTLALDIAKNFKKCRKNKHITQIELSKKSLIPYATIKKFEQTGQIALRTLLSLCDTLGIMDDFNNVLNPENHRSYEDLTHGR